MAEYIEREAVNKLLHKEIERTWHRVWGSVIWKLSHKISQIPAADVVEVVRCKDCRYSSPYLHYFYCENDNAPWAENTMANIVDANDFCSFGERRAGE